MPFEGLPGGGEMGELIRAHDWAATPLGSVEAWPSSLRVAVQLLLNTRHPMLIWWGPELIQFYNDAYRETMGPERHPAALGARGRDTWAETWDAIGPQIEHVMAGRGATWREDQLVPVTRHGVRQDAWWTYGFSPIEDEAAPKGVGGVLVIGRETTEAVLARRATEERYRTLFESMDEGFCILQLVVDGEGRPVDYRHVEINPAFERQTGVKGALGKTIRELVPAIEPFWFEVFGKVARTGEPVRFVDHAPSMGRWFDVHAFPTGEPRGRQVAVLLDDVTDRKRAEEALRDREERLRLIVEGARDYAIFTTDPEGRIDTWLPGAAAAFGWGAEEAVGRHVAMLFTPEDRGAGVPGEELEAARREGAAPDVRWHLRKDGSRAFIEGRVTALRGPDGGVRGFLKIGQDVTARRAADERQMLLAREVDHRAKNALAMVQSVLRLTPKDDAPAFARAVEGRVAALARAQTLLAGERWTGAELRELLRGELAPFLGGQRVDLDGPAVALPAAMVQPVAMAAHELATNADKYGALAVAEGRVSVSWRVDDGAPVAPGTLRLRWAEAGGPAVAGPPARRGFGSRVLDGTIRRQLGGEVSLAWNAEGLVCDLEIPLGRAAGTAAGPTGEDRARAAVAALRRFGDRLGAAERRVREAEARVTHQSLIIASIDGDRHPGQAILARRTLATLQRSLETARERLRVERANRRPAAVPAGSGEREVAVGAAGRAAEQAPEADR